MEFNLKAIHARRNKSEYPKTVFGRGANCISLENWAEVTIPKVEYCHGNEERSVWNTIIGSLK